MVSRQALACPGIGGDLQHQGEVLGSASGRGA
jgi:hypothetical protein